VTTMTNKLVLTATGMLAHEHRGIERVVRVIATIGSDVESCRFVEPSMLADVASFLRAFALQCQKAKEETMLYPLLEAKCMPRPTYLIASLAAEHSKAESLSTELLKNAAIYNSSGGARKSPLVDTLNDLVTLYRRHLWKEDNVLLPLAAEVLSRAELDVLYRAFSRMAPAVALDELAAGIERQSRYPPSHLGEILI
jgi:hemerythrin-like domain-containing protein